MVQDKCIISKYIKGKQEVVCVLSNGDIANHCWMT